MALFLLSAVCCSGCCSLRNLEIEQEMDIDIEKECLSVLHYFIGAEPK